MEADAALTARFGLLASSICGRPIVVATAKGDAWTDGRTVHVSTDTPHLRHQVIVQCALIRAGSLAPALVRGLVGRPAVARRYLALEGRRALTELTDVLPARALPDAGAFPVATSTLGGPEAALEIARSRMRLPDAPDWFGTIKPRAALGSEELDPTSPVNMPQKIRLSDEEGPDEDDSGDEEETGDESSILTSLSGIFGDNPLARALRKQLGTRSSASADGSSGGQAGAATATRGRRSTGRGVRMDLPEGLEERELHIIGPRLTLYPEWDEGRGAYKPEWCSVVEVVPASDELSPLERPARHDGLRRELAPLGLGLQRHRKQRGGYDLDLDAAIDARVTAATGHTPSDAVYVDNLRRRRELGVLVLLDASGSANELNPSGSALYQRQRDAAAALIDTFAILGDRVSGHAFRSMGRDVAFTRVKGFDETFGELEMARLGGVQPSGYTRMGAAIRHATSVVKADKAMLHRLLVVISDGFPYDTGYEGRYAEADTRMALSEARRAGVGCVALNLGSATDAAVLERVFGTAMHATAPDVDVLAPTLRRLILRALDAAHRDQRANRPVTRVRPMGDAA